LRSVLFVNQQTGWVGGFLNTLLKTTNAGNSWLTQNWFSQQSVMSFYFVNEQTGWAAGGTGNQNITLITKTSDGGQNWNTQYYSISTGMVMKLSFSNANTGWAATLNGNVLKTTNGGMNWNVIFTLTSGVFTSCCFVNQNTGWVIGISGTILKTTDGGNYWTSQISNTTQDLEGMHFINSTTGFIVGYNGIILKTTNAGINWISKPSGTNLWINSIFFVNDNTGWTAGGNYGNSASLILKTTNRGDNWTPQSSPTNNWLGDVFFINALTGWAVGRNGTIIKTTTGGVSPPALPTLVSPPNNSTDISVTPTMVWNASSGATNYKIQISTVANFLVVTDSATISNTQYIVTPEILSGGYTYFWRVNASNSQGTSSWSSVWSFSTALLPSAPTLISPSNGTIGTSTTPTLTWSNLPSIINYKIQISRVPNFTIIIDSTSVVTNQYIVPPGKLFDNITYFWRVNATNAFGSGPWSSVWSFTPQPTNFSLTGNEIPKETKLYNNYPNPFNPVTKIRFDVSISGPVNLKVFNIQGKEVAILVNSMLSAGSYETILNASSFPSGVYYYRIQTGEFSMTKRMVLVK